MRLLPLLFMVLAACATTTETPRGSFFDSAVPFRGGTPEARELLLSGDLVGATASAEERAQEDPTDIAAWYSLGSLRAGGRDWPGAAEALKQALRLDPNHAAAWNNLGIVKTELGDSVGAEAALRKAASLRADDTAPWVNLARLFTRGGRYADAVGAYDEALFRDPQDAAIAVAHAGALIRTTRFQEAADSLEASIQTYGETLDALIAYSTAYRLLGVPAEAVSQAERAVAKAPNDPRAMVTLALARDYGEDAKEAEVWYLRALAAADVAGELAVRLMVLYNWAEFLEEQKRTPEADAAFHRFLELAEDSPERRHVQIRFDRQKKEGSPP